MESLGNLSRRLLPPNQRIAARLRRVFGTLAVTYAVAMIVAWVFLIRVENNVHEIAGRAEPLSAAAYEMEINAIGSGMAILGYLRRPDPVFVARFEKDIADFNRFSEQYGKLARTPEEARLAQNAEDLYRRYIETGRSLVALRDSLDRHYSDFAGLSEELDASSNGRIGDAAPETTIARTAMDSEIADAISGVRGDLAEIGIWFAANVISGSTIPRRRIEERHERIAAQIARLEKISKTPEGRDAITDVHSIAKDMEMTVNRVLSVAAAIDVETIEFNRLRGAIDDILDDEIQVLSRENIASEQRTARQSAILALVVLSAVGVIMLVILAVSARRVAGVLVQPLDTLSRAARALSAGQLDHRLRFGRKDEIGDVADAFDSMAAKLEALYADLEGQVRDRTQELSGANAQLRDELVRRADVERELVVARDAARAADRAKSEFLARMSHELRTPLNAVIGFSEIIVMESLGPLGSPRYREYANDINVSANHLLSIINDILDLAKVEAGKITLNQEPVDIAAALDVAFHSVERMAAAKTVHPINNASTSLPCLSADPVRLHQILLNVLSNAVKFTEANGQVTVDATLRADAGLTITVRDTGIGMRPEDVPRALTPFEQVDNRLSRHFEGTGLGLPLVKMLLKLHDGEIEIESAPGTGTTVHLIFPPERTLLAPAAAAAI